ncbi:MAG: ABC transporter permease [Candidatus Kapabacteria bacterium]|nr:ABC transporter permease [Candidatus Kapabacteria bacterium]
MKKTKKNKDCFRINESANERILTPILPLTLTNANAYDKQLATTKVVTDCSKITLDFAEANLMDFDSYLVIFINRIRQFAKEKNVEFAISGLPSDRRNFVDLFSRKITSELPEQENNSSIGRYIENLGKKFQKMWRDSYLLIEFTGNLLIALVKMPFQMKKVRWKDFPFHFNAAGVNAVPICLLIVFLIGVIMGYQGALQLHQFGADIYNADLVGIAIARELSPLMTAILVAGRSGSAFAAEIGTMKVSEEIDALTTMGIDLYQFLVLPRVLAVTFSIPFITALADLSGIIGGLFASLTTLNITMNGFIVELGTALTYAHVFSGIIKSMLFGFLVASVGCFRGLQASGGAESVGKFTTAAVVTGVLLIVLSDSVLTFVLQVLGI